MGKISMIKGKYNYLQRGEEQTELNRFKELIEILDNQQEIDSERLNYIFDLIDDEEVDLETLKRVFDVMDDEF
jgi:hypothetical protein